MHDIIARQNGDGLWIHDVSFTMTCVSADLYVKLYVVNIATQKRIIKKKTRVCRHDREPSFNETFRFCMNPTGHSLQVSKEKSAWWILYFVIIGHDV